jgi:BCD family chlorophyll transporter-like MFS transporter
MLLLKRFQLALIHTAVAITLLPINSTLNRVMIKEMAFPAVLVAALASLPYLFSPLQIFIGSYSDRHPLFGRRRSPYILAGLLLCAAGVIFSPAAAFRLAENPGTGILPVVLTFGAWGMGFNLASVAYLSLASEISGEGGRSRTVSIMWFFMIVGIILTSIGLGRLLQNFSPAVLESSFRVVGLAALLMGILGLIGLEGRALPASFQPSPERRPSWRDLLRVLVANPQARRFFVYLVILLAAILGQDILLEPFAAQAFGLSVEATTRITSIWGTCFLVALVFASLLEKRLGKRRTALAGSWGAAAAFLLIAASGWLLHNQGVFYSGVVLLGLATGLATVSNLSLMLDMTTSQVGLFIGAWGMAEAGARLAGSLISGGLRDLFARLAGDPLSGYTGVFLLEAIFLLVSIALLRRIDVSVFRQQAVELSLTDRTALLSEGS